MQTILITGGSQGIGLGLVKAYLAKGDTVINIDKHTPKENITGAYYYVYADLADTSKLESVFEEAKQKTKRIDVLILNAAHQENKPFEALTLEDLNQAFDVNLKANIILAQRYVKQFYGANGRLIIITSTRAFMSEKDTIPYSVSKGGLEALKHSLALTLSDKKITVNAIAPGWIHTTDQSALRTLDHTFHPSGRVGKVSDIVKACFYISDPDNDFLNGETLVVDGGVTKKMIYPE